MKKQFLFILAAVAVPLILLVSCKKDSSSNSDNTVDVSLFYGKWKTNYGDTMIFSQSNNKNMLNYQVSLNPAFAPRGNNEFTYKDDKLGLKDGFGGPDNFRFFDSFKWIQKGSIFEIQGIQWFMFLSASSTYFTFTKIP